MGLASKEHMGLHTWTDAPHGKIQKFDVVVAKNYLTASELALSRPRMSKRPRLAASAREQEEVPEGYGEDWGDDFEYIARYARIRSASSTGGPQCAGAPPSDPADCAR